MYIETKSQLIAEYYSEERKGQLAAYPASIEGILTRRRQRIATKLGLDDDDEDIIEIIKGRLTELTIQQKLLEFETDLHNIQQKLLEPIVYLVDSSINPAIYFTELQKQITLHGKHYRSYLKDRLKIKIITYDDDGNSISSD